MDDRHIKNYFGYTFTGTFVFISMPKKTFRCQDRFLKHALHIYT